MDPNTLLATLYSIIILILIYTYLSRRRYYKLMNQFPGPVQIPFIGILHRLFTPRKMLKQFRKLIDIYETDGTFAFFGHQPGLFTMNPILLEKIFTSPNFYDKPDIVYRGIRDLFGDGIFTATKVKWQRNRKLISPAFRKPVLRKFLPVFHRNTGILKKKLNLMADKGGEQSVLGMMQKFTLTVAMETVLGYEMPAGTELDQKVVQNYFDILWTTIIAVPLNVLRLSSTFKYFGFYKTRDAIYSFVTDLVKKRVEHNASKLDINENIRDNVNDDEDTTENRYIFVDQLLKSHERGLFSWHEVLDESNSIIFAAFETTATTIFYSLAFLAMHQDIQEKAYEYVKSIYPYKDFEVDFEIADHYDYLNMIISETLRHVPPVPEIARIASANTQLTEDIFIPKDTVILINILETHFNQKLWGPDAEKYNPEQFSPENVSSRNPYAFLAFSRGLRNCIGAKYAMIAIKVVLYHLIRNYHFKTSFKPEDLIFENNIIMRAKKVPQLEVHIRED